MAAMAYNLKKLLKFINKSAQAKKQGIAAFLNRILDVILAIISLFKPIIFCNPGFKNLLLSRINTLERLVITLVLFIYRPKFGLVQGLLLLVARIIPLYLLLYHQ